MPHVPRTLKVWALASIIWCIGASGFQFETLQRLPRLPAVFGMGKAFGDPQYWTSKRREACPEGHKAPIQLGGITLYIDFRTITVLELGTNPAPSGDCPAAPFKASSVFFYYHYEELRRLYKERRLALFSLKIEAREKLTGWGLPLPPFSDHKREVAHRGFVEDVTDRVVVDRRPVVMSRAYLLQLSDESSLQEPILVRCHGDPATGANRRDCEAWYFIEPGLAVRYVVRQDARDLPTQAWNIAPEGPILEPDGLLEIDRQVRGFFEYLRSSQSNQ